MPKRPDTQSRAVLTLFFCLLFAAAGAPLLAEDPRVSISVSPRGKVGLQELLQVTISIESTGRTQIGTPTLEVESLRLVSGPNQSSSLRIINGVSSRTLSFSWIVQPTALGTATVKNAKVPIGGRVTPVEDLKIQVVDNPPERTRSARQRSPFDIFSRDPFFSDADRPFESRRRRRPKQHPPRLYLEAQAVPENPSVGQQVTYTLYVYYDVNVRNATPGTLPDFKGFWTLVIPQPERTKQERVVRDGREIHRAVLFERALFPRRAGRLEIEPVEQTLTALIPDSSPLGSLMPRMRELKSTSNAVTVNVKSLPEPKPDGFSGLVGRIQLNAEADRSQLEVGEAVTLTLRLEGEGHLQGVQPPPLGEIAGVQIMPPQELSEQFIEANRVRGRRLFSYVLVPKKPGLIEIPSLEMPFFDPRRGEYRLAATESLSLEVSGSSGLVAQGSQEVSLHPVRTANLPAAGSSEGFGEGTLPHILVLSPIALGALFLLFGRARSSAILQGRRQLRHALDLAAKEEKTRQSAALIEEAWRSYLEEKWQIPKGTPSPNWGTLLAENGASRAAANELVSLGDDLHYLRYAPKLSSTSEMRDELIERSRKLLKAI